jgi:hypothetical protein
MASQVLSGASNATYTNNTGQNVRIVINYMSGTATGISLNWAGVSVSAALAAIGRNLASSYIDIVDPPNNPFRDSITNTGTTTQSTSISLAAATYPGYGVASNNNALARTVTTTETYTFSGSLQSPAGTKTTGSGALPTELMLASGQTFSAQCGVYNIVVIPEAG